MPAEKRLRDPYEEDPEQDAEEDSQLDVNEFQLSDSISSGEETSELVEVNLPETRKEVQCPICLGIIRKTRTVMECLHRFCRECIDKSMRLGNNECPACRTHCASRRSLRDDPIFDMLISILYPDIDKYEEEKLAFHYDEELRIKQIQASIAETVRRQNNALGKWKQTGRAATTTAVYARRSSRRKTYGLSEQQLSENSADSNGIEGAKESSGDEPDFRSRRWKRLPGSRHSQPSSASFNTDGCHVSNTEVTREPVLASVSLGTGSDRLAWGQSGLRSNKRSGGYGKNARNSRVHKLVDHFLHLGEINDEIWTSWLFRWIKKMWLVYRGLILSCKPNQTVGDLCQYVAYQTRMQSHEIELLLVKDSALKSDSPVSNLMPDIMFPWNVDKQVIDLQETLGHVKDMCNTYATTHMVLAYRKKMLEPDEAVKAEL